MSALAATAVVGSAYLAGSLNLAVALHHLGAIPDPRGQGSGNPGVSNVRRVAGLGWAAALLLLELGRAAAVAILARRSLGSSALALAGLAIVLGSRYPIFHRLRGGKGVAALLGFSATIFPLVALTGVAAWLLGYAIFRRSYLGSLPMVAILSAGTAWRGGFEALPSAAALAIFVLILLAHRPNLSARPTG